MCVFIADPFSSPLAVNMAGDNKVSIKLFGFIKKTCENIGIFRPQLSQNSKFINFKTGLLLFGETQFFISTTGYLLFEANSIVEYGMVFFTCTSIVLSIIFYSILTWQMANILNYIENCERFIEESE